MTEEQAKTRWCPMIRYTMDDQGNFFATRPITSTGFEVCITSDCMMWRMGTYKGDDNITYRDHSIGYCGLAGKP